MANAISRLFDPADASRDRVPRRYQFAGDARWWTVSLGVGAAALATGVAVGVGAGVQRLLFAYLIAWAFCTSISVAALLWVMVQHIVKARWSTSTRRIAEAIAANVPLLALAGLPVLFGIHDLYHWSHADLYQPGAHYDPILAGKAGYFFWPLAPGSFPAFFVLRYVVYFAIWSWLATRLYRISVENDTRPDPQNTLRMRKIAGYGIPLTGVTFAFAGFDWMMSTDPHWFSTMFGVYFFAGGWLGAICLITFTALLLKKGGMLQEEVTKEHLHDLGRFMFGFTVFWTYIAFSQYMLYWYANLAEETVWFAKRFTGGWMTVTWALVLFHFAVPFFILLLRISKRTFPILATMAVWLLVMHWVDLWWVAGPARVPAAEGHAAEAHAAAPAAPEATPLVVPAALQVQRVDPATPAGAQAGDASAHAATGAEPHPATEFRPSVVEPAPPVVEFLTWIGLFGLLFGVTLWRLARHALTPYGDPYFADSLRLQNV